MAITIDELFTSQRGGAGSAGQMSLTYVVRGTDTLSEVRTTVEATAPSTWDEKYIGPAYNVEQVGPEMWIASVPYGPDTTQNRTSSSPAEYSFQISAETAHVDVSLDTLESQPAGSAPDYEQLVNVSVANGKVKVGGADILKPKYEFGQSKIYSNAFLTTAKKKEFADLVGTVNDDTFQGMDAGTVIYLGCQGDKRGRGDWDVRHRFAYSPNRTDVEIGTLTLAAVGGWDYVWVVYQEAADEANKAMKAVPKFAYVEKMYEPGDFDILAL